MKGTFHFIKLIRSSKASFNIQLPFLSSYYVETRKWISGEYRNKMKAGRERG